MIIGPCYNCKNAVYDTDIQDRAIYISRCDLHFGNHLNFCSDACLESHNQQYHTSVDIA